MTAYIPLSVVVPESLWPQGLFSEENTAFLDNLACLTYDEKGGDDTFSIYLQVKVMAEARISLPFLQGTEFVLGKGDGPDSGLIDVEVSAEVFPDAAPSLELTLSTTVLSLSLDSQMFRPVEVEEEDGKLKVTPKEGNVSIPLPFALKLKFENEDWSIDFEVPAGEETSLNIPTCMIGDSGVIFEASNISLNFSGNGARPAGAPQDWKGLFLGQLKIYLPELFNGHIDAIGFGIGTGGFYGNLSASFPLTYNESASPKFSGSLATGFLGMEGGISSISLGFIQNRFTEAAIRGKILLPFFQKPLDILVGIDVKGGLTVGLAGSGGLAELELHGILRLQISSLELETKDGLVTFKIGGKLTPRVGEPDLKWPGFEVKELSIDSDGNVRLQGGWLDLHDQYSLDFYGFIFEITKIGFGKNDDGGKWIGFNGGLKLVDGFSAGASVEGLRITWHDDLTEPQFSFEGVGVEFDLPDVMTFKGAVSYKKETEGGKLLRRFAGAIKLKLHPLDLTIDGVLVFGSEETGGRSTNFFAIYLTTELPKGIPLFGSGLALYGMAGLFAYQMEPNKTPDQEWYKIGEPTSWYLKAPVGITDLKGKWTVKDGSLALGAGVTIGTQSDNGKAFAAKVLLVLVLPGPIIMLQGGANINKNRKELSGNKEPDFRAIAVLDNRAGTFTLGLDAKYRYGSGAELIDVRGSAEAFYSFNHADAWHVYLGEKEPRSKRVRAELYRLFDGDCYVMVDARQLALGAGIGYDGSWGFSRLKVALEAWIESNAVVSWSPTHFFGELWMHGSASLKVFRFSTGLTVDARIDGDVFEPKHVKGNFKVKIKLPWFLPSYGANITLEWGPEKTAPLLPIPLKEVSIDHKKSTTTWPLPRKLLLLPDYDADDDGLRDRSNPAPVDASFLPDHIPIIPMDSSPTITFNRPINDDAQVGARIENMSPETERIGDPAKNRGPLEVRYGLTEVSLQKRVSPGWETVALKKAGVPNPAGTPELFGSWAPVPAMPDGGGDKTNQVKLMLRSKTPFDYSRESGRTWDEWFTDRFVPNGYPCAPAQPDRVICWNFEKIGAAQKLKSPLRSVEHPGLTLSWESPPAVKTITTLEEPVAGLSHALCFPRASGSATAGGSSSGNKVISLPAPAKTVEIIVASVEEPFECLSFRDRATGETTQTQIKGVSFKYTDFSGTPKQTISFGDLGQGAGIDFAGFGTKSAMLELILPCLASVVDLTISFMAPPVTIEAYNSAGTKVTEVTGISRSPDLITLSSNGIKKILIKGNSNRAFLHEICYSCPATSGRAQATGQNAAGKTFPGVYKDDNTISISGDGLTSVTIDGKEQVCILQICALTGPGPAEDARRIELDRHLQTQMERWKQVEEILEPYADYRLGVVTTIQGTGQGELQGESVAYTQNEVAYFRTDGPPGLAKLARPIDFPDTSRFDSGLDDLTRYVTQTVPVTVPKPGEKPPLVRPVYRAYDVSINFDGNYVDLMYRIAKRDLVLYLYDNNNRPVRDETGRIVILENRWGTARELTLTESEQRWLTIVDESSCAAFGLAGIPHHRTLTAFIENLVLEADTLYDARLMPVLLLEDFSELAVNTTAAGTGAALALWRVVDQGTPSETSRWVIEDAPGLGHRVAQTSNIVSITGAAAGLGTLLLRGDDPDPIRPPSEQPGAWTDYRFSAHLRSSTDGAIGVVFRYKDEGNYYRFSMERTQPYRRLTRVAGAAVFILAEDDFVFSLDQDYAVTVEAVGSSLRIYQDDSLVFDVNDDSNRNGRPGLYCAANSGASFNSVRVDNFGAASPVVYRYGFTTSRFANFFHQMHSFQDETWLASANLNVPANPFVISLPPSEEEARAYEALIANVPAAATSSNLNEVQVTRIKQGTQPVAFLLQSLEPIDWERTELKIKTALQEILRPHFPGAVKITDVAFGTDHPSQESVTLLLRESTDISNYRIEYRQADSSPGASTWSPYYIFGPETRLPAGTRVRVYASSETDTPLVSEAGIVRRFISSPGVTGQLRLQSGGVALRLVVPDGSEGHVREFIPDAAYAELSPDIVRVVRKADGTGFFVIAVTAGSSAIRALPAARYRLEMTYLRENTVAHPDSPILSQAGDSLPEHVKLDVPWQTIP